jgi:t-SNARE complex subunit (syntaxin)
MSENIPTQDLDDVEIGRENARQFRWRAARREHRRARRARINVWLVIGAAILIILLLIWLTDAIGLFGATDVSAPDHFVSMAQHAVLH